MKQKWTKEEIWSWYKAQPWITGFNFIPSGAVDGGIWLLQEYDHEHTKECYELDCPHERGEHDDCGYKETVEGHLCSFICGECSMIPS